MDPLPRMPFPETGESEPPPDSAPEIVSEPPVEVCAGCGETYAPSLAATEHANCKRAYDRAFGSRTDEVMKLRNDLHTQTQARIEIEDKLVRTKGDLDRLRLQTSPPSDDKLRGIREHAFDALENFFSALQSFRREVERNSFYGLPGDAKTLLDTVDALMFLDERTRPALDELRPVFESLNEIERLGWFRERYGSARIDAVRVFLALDILRRTVGLKPRPTGKDD